MDNQACRHTLSADRKCHRGLGRGLPAREHRQIGDIQSACAHSESDVKTLSRAEIRIQLEDYLEDLQSEIAAVKEIVDLMKRQDGE